MQIQSIPPLFEDLLPENSPRRLISDVVTLTKLLRETEEARRSANLIVPIERLSEYIAFIEVLHDGLVGSWERPTLFRGHANASWPLVPSLMREHMFLDENPTSTAVEALEDELLSQFERRALPVLVQPPHGRGSRWRWAALAQHHNLPTRLLDWTYRATTALYFAVGFEPPKQYGGFSCVWAIQSPPEYHEVQRARALRLGIGNRFVPTDDWPVPQHDKDLAVCKYDPPHVSPRITMQQACFTAHPSHYKRKYFDWIDGVRVIFLVHEGDRNSLKGGLERIGVNREVLFPGLDGIAAHLTEVIPPRHWPLHSNSSLHSPR